MSKSIGGPRNRGPRRTRPGRDRRYVGHSRRRDAHRHPNPSSSGSTASPAASKSTDPNLYPFGAPTGGSAVKVPSPARGRDPLADDRHQDHDAHLRVEPYEEAVSVTQHIWPSALPENAPNLVPDRPRRSRC